MSAGLLRQLKGRIRSVENTKKITYAMEMVSAAKLRRFQNMMLAARPYTQGLEEMLVRLAGGSETHPFFEEREEKNAAVVLLTSDSGLCGPYNMALIDLARNFLRQRQLDKKPFHLVGVGKMGITAVKKRGHTFARTFTEIKMGQVEPTIKTLKEELEMLYLKGKVDAVHVIYSHFISSTTHTATIEKILPLKKPSSCPLPPPGGEGERGSGGAGEGVSVPYIYEPSPEAIFKRLIPEFFEAKMRMLFLEAYVAEHMARMQAMHQATKNAKEMTDTLVLSRNKVRQAIITKEIIEIISGSKAQKN